MNFDITITVKAKNPYFAEIKAFKKVKGSWGEPEKYGKYKYTLIGSLDFNSEEELYDYFNNLDEDITLHHSEPIN